MKSCCTLHTFSALAPDNSLMHDHITRGLGPESDHRKRLASSSAVYTLTHSGRYSVLQKLQRTFEVLHEGVSRQVVLPDVLSDFLDEIAFLNIQCLFKLAYRTFGSLGQKLI